MPKALLETFHCLVTTVGQLTRDGISITVAEESAINSGESIAPIFSYILTPKQLDRVKKICKQEGWPLPHNRGVTLTLKTIEHVIGSRTAKDNCDETFITEILAKAFSQASEVNINKQHNQQVLVFNGKTRLTYNGNKYHALAVIQVTKEEELCILKPVTAYHATEAKIRGIKRK